jgi:hypothetical protein
MIPVYPIFKPEHIAGFSFRQFGLFYDLIE